jgi:hypothetical protein
LTSVFFPKGEAGQYRFPRFLFFRLPANRVILRGNQNEQQWCRKLCALNMLLGIFETIAREERGTAAVPVAEGQTTDDAATRWQRVYRK